ncbi:hypothetical protein CRUP_000901 [Coryphaenoides rupestris]|nr:hypothetical protein CRUP_000901 [Coryphaenoides rupestris]
MKQFVPMFRPGVPFCAADQIRRDAEREHRQPPPPVPLNPESSGRPAPRPSTMTRPGPGRDLLPPPPPPDHRQQQQQQEEEEEEEEEMEGDLRLDFFRKLGFSPGEVRATLRRLGPATDTNSVLGELVGSKSHQQAGRSCSPDVAWPAGRSSSSNGSRVAGGTVSTPSPPPANTPPSAAAVWPDERIEEEEEELKAVVIDGSNVAMSHGNKEVFSCQGILLAVNYFLLRGHTAITVFVPSWRKEQPRPDAQITDQYILTELEKRKILVFTPSRRVGGKRVVCYDDRFIVKLAHESDGVIVSNDTYQDLQAERPEWRKCIDERLLMYSFVNDKFMPPDDPLGRHGPSLDNFLRKRPLVSEPNKPLCPYDKKCTYGIKCKFYHPERANQAHSSLADELREKARIAPSKLDRKSRLSPRGSHCEPSLATNPRCLDLETEPWPSLEPRGSTRFSGTTRHAPATPVVTENTLICRDGVRTTQNHASAAAVTAQKDWPGPAYPSHHPYSGLSQDSGLGSYESQLSGDGQSLWSRPPQLPVYLEGHGPRSACGHCAPAAPPTGRYPSSSTTSSYSSSQPKYDTFPPYAYPPSMHQYYSLPGHLQQGREQNHNQQQQQQQTKYWSDPFHMAPEVRLACSLSGPLAGPPHPGGPSCAYREQVDAVMEMFPHLTDAQKLAAEILKLKAQGEVF